MTMRDLKSNVAPVNALAPQSITSAALTSGNVDLFGFNAAAIVVALGTVDGLNAGAPTSGTIAVKLEHADDDGTGSPGAYADVALADVVGPVGVSAGVVATLSESNAGIQNVGYVGGKRFIRVTLTPSGLGTGGPVAVVVNKGHPRHGPAA